MPPSFLELFTAQRRDRYKLSEHNDVQGAAAPIRIVNEYLPDARRGRLVKLVEPDHLWDVTIHIRVFLRHRLHLLEYVWLAFTRLLWPMEPGNHVLGCVLTGLFLQ